jgi:hypothetical protein
LQKITQPTRFTAQDHREASAILAGMVGRLQVVRDRIQARFGRQHLLAKSGQAATASVNVLRIGLEDLSQQDGFGIAYPVANPERATTPNPDLQEHAIATRSEGEGID